ncbi:MAG: tryptophan synthase subunit alpha [Planctomycetes bacterium]|nr:tryptophan synthase subunit alpha [Planctomycetota bacterium]
MSRIEDTFAKLADSGQKAFMPFITACDPSVETTVEIVVALEAAGADIVELGVAYSDPLADGPVIQDSYHRVLSAGGTVADFFRTVREIRKRSQIPIAAMVTYTIVWKVSPEEFVEKASQAGVDALIVPDLPPEEAQRLVEAAGEKGLGVIFLAAPTTTPERIKKIVAVSAPFIYYVSVVGTTGARDALPRELAGGVAAAKALTDKPVVVGFGVSSPETAAAVAKIADGVIVGSAIVRVITENASKSPKEIAAAVADFARPIAEAVKA